MAYEITLMLVCLLLVATQRAVCVYFLLNDIIFCAVPLLWKENRAIIYSQNYLLGYLLNDTGSIPGRER